jgi:hypothetical protein
MPVHLASDGAQKIDFSDKSLPHSWAHIRAEYTELYDTATNHFLPVPTPYNCEPRFSNFIEIKPKKRNPPDMVPLPRLKITAAQSKARNVSAGSKAGIVSSNPSLCMRLFCVCVVLCAGSGLFFFMGWDLRHQVLRPLLAYCTVPDD